MRAELVRYECDLADVLPRAVERAGDEDIAGSGFTDDDGVTAIRQDKGGDVVALTLLIVGPAKAFIDVGSHESIADGVDGLGTEPCVVAEGLVPAACEDVVLAVRAVDDLPIPVVPQFHGGVFEAVLLIARPDGGRTPCSGRERGDDRRGLEVVDKGLAGTSGGLRGTLSGGGTGKRLRRKKTIGMAGGGKRHSKRLCFHRIYR